MVATASFLQLFYRAFPCCCSYQVGFVFERVDSKAFLEPDPTNKDHNMLFILGAGINKDCLVVQVVPRVPHKRKTPDHISNLGCSHDENLSVYYW